MISLRFKQGCLGFLVVCLAAMTLAACGGKGSGEAGPTPTLSAEQLNEIKAIPDLSCESCPPKAEVVSEQDLSDAEAEAAIGASKEANAILTLASQMGYGDILRGLKTTYSDGTIVNSALIAAQAKGAAILATSTGPTAASALIRLDPDNPDQLIVTDGNGSATVSWAGELIDSQETHNSCHYWHCVGSAISWLYKDSWYAALLGDVCHQCAEDLDEYYCGLCLAASPSGLLAGVVDCGIDSCDFCKNDSCGDDVVKSHACMMDLPTTMSTHVAVYAIYETVDDYYCQNPGQETSQCSVDQNAIRKAQTCPGECAADHLSCAPATPRTCDPTTCSAQKDVYSTGGCHKRQLGPQVRWEIEWTGRMWSCQPDGAGGSICTPGQVGTYYRRCLYGCDIGSTACHPGPTPTPTRTPLPVCSPATCEREEPDGDPRCAYSYGEEGWIVEQDFRHYTCQPQASGGTTCEYTTALRRIAQCPYGCAADGKSCAQASAVPEAPSAFLVLQHAGGTEFQWQDNSDNEQGFHIYFGGRSVGRPATLIATAGPNTSELDTTFVRAGQEICWEIYAFNAAGESAPAYYCLPP
jgi:hypothetical protein